MRMMMTMGVGWHKEGKEIIREREERKRHVLVCLYYVVCHCT